MTEFINVLSIEDQAESANIAARLAAFAHSKMQTTSDTIGVIKEIAKVAENLIIVSLAKELSDKLRSDLIEWRKWLDDKQPQSDRFKSGVSFHDSFPEHQEEMQSKLRGLSYPFDNEDWIAFLR